jgi:hypothetical protein
VGPTRQRGGYLARSRRSQLIDGILELTGRPLGDDAWQHRFGVALHVHGDRDGAAAVGAQDRCSRSLEGCECGWGGVAEEVVSADGDHRVARMYGGDERRS